MDLSAYLLDQAIAATTPPGETEAEARTRADAMAEMLRAYAPGDMMETMMACQCIMMQFIVTAAMRDANNPRLESAAQGKARAGAIAASRALQQWVTKFEHQRKRNELRATQLAKVEAAKSDAAKAESAVKPVMEAPSELPDPYPVVSPIAPAHVQNGQITDIASPLDPLLAAAASMRNASLLQGHSASGLQHRPPRSAVTAT